MQFTLNTLLRNDGDRVVSAWHPAGRGDITPLYAQILYASTADNFSSSQITYLGSALGASKETIENILQNLIDGQLLLRRVMSPFDKFIPTTSGYAVLNKVATRKPEILTMTKVLLENRLNLVGAMYAQ